MSPPSVHASDLCSLRVEPGTPFDVSLDPGQPRLGVGLGWQRVRRDMARPEVPVGGLPTAQSFWAGIPSGPKCS
jgi:hypothetical protein